MPSHIFLLVIIGALAGQQPGELSVSATPRAVRDVTERPKVDNIEFVGFDFQKPELFELTVHYSRIEGEPSIGVEYGVEASIGGHEAIATAAFDVVDENGTEIQRVAIVPEPDGASGYDFVGLMTVPAHPFRIVLSGEGVDGRKFRRVYRRLFKPIDGPDPGFVLPADLSIDEQNAFRSMFTERAPAAIAERQALVARNPGGAIVMPRVQVSHVMYAPVFSPTGRPMGIRITYDVEVSETIRANPSLRIFAEDKEDSSIGRNPLHALKSTIEPLPHEYYAPEKEAERTLVLFGQWADFLYAAGTRYRFALELVPNYLILEKDGITPCVLHQRFRLERDPSKAFARMLASTGPTSYRLFIGHTAFEGKIENYYGEGTFYQNFRTEGLQDCSDQR